MTSHKESKRKNPRKRINQQAKAPPIKPADSAWAGWKSKAAKGGEARGGAASLASRLSKDLDAKLDTVLGRATYVDDLLRECGYGKR